MRSLDLYSAKPWMLYRLTEQWLKTCMLFMRKALLSSMKNFGRNSLNQAVGFNPENGTGGIDTVRSVPTLIPSGNTALDVSNALTEMDADILSASHGM